MAIHQGRRCRIFHSVLPMASEDLPRSQASLTGWVTSIGFRPSTQNACESAGYPARTNPLAPFPAIVHLSSAHTPYQLKSQRIPALSLAFPSNRSFQTGMAAHSHVFIAKFTSSLRCFSEDARPKVLRAILASQAGKVGCRMPMQNKGRPMTSPHRFNL